MMRSAADLDTSNAARVDAGEVGPPLDGDQQDPQLLNGRFQNGPCRRDRALTPKCGDQLAELTLYQPWEGAVQESSDAL
jgi:hypothetical protein